MSVNIEFIGHACFRVWCEGGPVVVMDPYDPAELEKYGLPKGSRPIEGDTVIVSSLTDPAHGTPKSVRGNPRVINALDVAFNDAETHVNGSRVIAVPAAESPEHPKGAKRNALYALKFGDLWVMHLGDLGYGLSPEELAPFVGRCDVLLAIVGQSLTIPLKDLDLLIDHLKPKWLVPMHYLLPPFGVGAALRPLGEFLVRRPQDPLIYPRCSTVKLPLEIPAKAVR